jgi:3-hydroxyisobutyrate dehydrogenase
MLERRYGSPNFPARHLAKDVELFLAEARSASLGADHLEAVRKLLGSVIKSGLGDEDYSAIYEAVNPRSSGSHREEK